MDITKEQFESIVKDIAEVIAARALQRYTHFYLLDKDEGKQLESIVESTALGAITEALEPFLI